MNPGFIILDYLLQTKEQNGKFDTNGVRDMITKAFCGNLGTILNEEIDAVVDLCHRIMALDK